ncbi:hypothetical protein CRG98_038333 [Punica granatum]|uniref:Uncharacterized protein n=1 Tax=Punica granatum TaxID=22663 RepID=A0A2I0IB99_PUNGR|nr:hypothetical protein CRG98_038333 [Punica granatum]
MEGNILAFIATAHFILVPTAFLLIIYRYGKNAQGVEVSRWAIDPSIEVASLEPVDPLNLRDLTAGSPKLRRSGDPCGPPTPPLESLACCPTRITQIKGLGAPLSTTEPNWGRRACLRRPTTPIGA